MVAINVFVSFIFSLRGAVLALLACLIFIDTPPAALQLLDRWVLKAGVQLALPRTALVETALIQLPADEMERLQSDPVSAEAVMELLTAFQRESDVTLGVVLEQLPRTQLLQSEHLLQSRFSQQSQRFLQQRDRAIERLQHDSVLLMVPAQDIAHSSRSQPVTVAPMAAEDWYARLPKNLQPALATRTGVKVAGVKVDNTAALSVWPLTENKKTLQYPLLVASGDSTDASVALVLFQHMLGVDSVQWLQRRELLLGDKLLPASVDGSIVPFYSVHSGVKAPLNILSLRQALHSPPDKPIVLLGGEGDARVMELANVLVSLQQGAYLYSPYWFYGAEKMLLLLLAVFLLFMAPRLSGTVLMLVSLLAVVLMLAAQLGWLVTQRQWLPFGVSIEFLIVGTLLMLVWSARQRQWLALAMDCHHSHYRLAQQWLQQDRLKEALDAIEKCQTTEPVLTLAYDVAARQEGKRQYEAAAATYRMIVSRKRNFKDAAKREQALLSLKTTNSQTSSLDVTHTLVMPDASVNQPILGRYEIERELGRGAMGVVYLGHDPKISRRVAIKTLNYKQFNAGQLKSLKERFFREAEAAGRLQHPNIITVYDVGEEADLAFIAMDFVEGESLSEYIVSDSLLAVNTVYDVVAQVAEALSYAHQQNIVHRDIKPGNIIYNSETGQAKVADFGIARITDDSKTKTGDILGSPIYMSPEQLKGIKVTGASDIYSLGVTLYQLLTGEVPFNGDSIANLAYQILNRKYKSVRDIRASLPASAVRIINKAMQKDPAKRYTNAADMAEALRKSLARDF